MDLYDLQEETKLSSLLNRASPTEPPSGALVSGYSRLAESGLLEVLRSWGPQVDGDFLSAEGILRTAFELGSSSVLQPKPRQLGFQLLQLAFQLWQLDLQALTPPSPQRSSSPTGGSLEFGFGHDSLFSLAQDVLASPQTPLSQQRETALKKAVNGFPRLLTELVLSQEASGSSRSELQSRKKKRRPRSSAGLKDEEGKMDTDDPGQAEEVEGVAAEEPVQEVGVSFSTFNPVRDVCVLILVWLRMCLCVCVRVQLSATRGEIFYANFHSVLDGMLLECWPKVARVCSPIIQPLAPFQQPGAIFRCFS